MLVPSLAFKNRNVNKLLEMMSNKETALAEPIACCINAQEYLQIQKGGSGFNIWCGFISCIHANSKMK